VVGIDNVCREKHDARNAMMRMGRGGIPMTPVYEDMHATDIRQKEKRRKKLMSMRRTKSREQPEIYIVELCDQSGL